MSVFNSSYSLFRFVESVTVNSMTIDIGKPIKTGCKPNGCPKTCQITAVIKPPHMDATPAAFVTLFQYNPNSTGAIRLETAIVVPFKNWYNITYIVYDH